MITLDQAKDLKHGTILYHTLAKNADGSAQRWRVNGKPKVWKTRPDEVKVPIKHGLRTFGYLTELDLDSVSLTEKVTHEITYVSEGDGYGGTQQATCSCGWKGQEVGNYHNSQHSVIRGEASSHLKKVGVF